MKRSQFRRAAGIAVAAFLAFSVATSAQITGQVTQVITPNNGALAVVLTGLTMTTATSSASAQTTTGNLIAVTTDLRGATTGFNVSLVSTDFAYLLVAGELEDVPSLPASGFRRVGAASFVGAGSGAPTGSYTGPLDTAAKVISAAPGRGAGTYTATLPVNLAIPSNTVPGTYTATLTATITDGP